MLLDGKRTNRHCIETKVIIQSRFHARAVAMEMVEQFSLSPCDVCSKNKNKKESSNSSLFFFLSLSCTLIGTHPRETASFSMCVYIFIKKVCKRGALSVKDYPGDGCNSYRHPRAVQRYEGCAIWVAFQFGSVSIIRTPTDA